MKENETCWGFEDDWYIQPNEGLMFCVNTKDAAEEYLRMINDRSEAEVMEKIKWFMELALKMKEQGFSDVAIYSVDIDAWDDFRQEGLTPLQAIQEDDSNA